MATVLLHDTSDFGDLIEVLAGQTGIDPGLVEKDYWIMHALWGLQQGGFIFELKGGTSLSNLEKACAKLRVRTRIEAVAVAVRTGIIDPEAT